MKKQFRVMIKATAVIYIYAESAEIAQNIVEMELSLTEIEIGNLDVDDFDCIVTKVIEG